MVLMAGTSIPPLFPGTGYASGLEILPDGVHWPSCARGGVIWNSDTGCNGATPPLTIPAMPMLRIAS